MEDWFKPIGGSLEIPKVATKSGHHWGQLTSHKKTRKPYQPKKAIQLTGLTLEIEKRLARRFKRIDIELAKLRTRICSGCKEKKSRASGIRVKDKEGQYSWICGDCNRTFLKKCRKRAKMSTA